MSTVPPLDVIILTKAEVAELAVETIRAFVERVEKRLPEYSTGRGAEDYLKGYRQAVYAELAAIEGEAK